MGFLSFISSSAKSLFVVTKQKISNFFSAIISCCNPSVTNNNIIFNEEIINNNSQNSQKLPELHKYNNNINNSLPKKVIEESPNISHSSQSSNLSINKEIPNNKLKLRKKPSFNDTEMFNPKIIASAGKSFEERGLNMPLKKLQYYPKYQ